MTIPQPEGSTGLQMCYNKFRDVPRLKGFIYYATFTGNFWFLRTH